MLRLDGSHQAGRSTSRMSGTPGREAALYLESLLGRSPTGMPDLGIPKVRGFPQVCAARAACRRFLAFDRCKLVGCAGMRSPRASVTRIPSKTPSGLRRCVRRGSRSSPESERRRANRSFDLSFSSRLNPITTFRQTGDTSRPSRDTERIYPKGGGERQELTGLRRRYPLR